MKEKEKWRCNELKAHGHEMDVVKARWWQKSQCLMLLGHHIKSHHVSNQLVSLYNPNSKDVPWFSPKWLSNIFGLININTFYLFFAYIYIYLVFFLLNFYQLYFGHFSNLKYLFLSKYDFICDIKIFGFASLFKT